jgi:ubiquinone/menaquinone biosynthesis C-methylase UbiE
MTTAVDHKARQKSQWGGAAAAWDHRFEWYSHAFGPLIRWCCDAAGLQPGMQVLDVASGSGQPAFEAARRVGPTGRVTAIDLSSEMVTLTSTRARAAGLDHLTVTEMDAETLHFSDRTFDAVTCACGVMFFPDADRAVSEMHRVLRPGGRIAVAVWDHPSKSPFLTVGGQALAQVFPPAPPEPNAPGAFRFSQPDELRALLERGAFHDVRVESIPMTIELHSIDDYWDVFTSMAAGVKEKIASLGDAERARLRNLVETASAAHLHNAGLRLVATPLGAIGMKPNW